MLLFFLEIIYPRVPGALAPQDFLNTALPEDVLSLYAKYLINLSVWTGGMLALAGLIYGGILYLISTGKPDRMTLAKNQISAAFFGLLLLLSSYLVLKTISPQFINLKIPALQQVQIPVKPDVPLPEITAINSSIDVEMPFARIIEKIFETYISDYPKPEEEETPRMIRIKEITETTKEITDKLKEQNEKLKDYTETGNPSTADCRCFYPRFTCSEGGGTHPDPCCWWWFHSSCGNCPPKHCSSDPCKDVRNEMQNIKEKNHTEINNLTAEQIKTEQEVRLLKEQLDRLKRAEKFIKECPLRSLTSLVQFYNKKDSYDNQGWTIRETKFWDDVNIQYYTGQYTAAGGMYAIATEKIAFDFATFYCSVSGTMEQEEVFPVFAPDEDELTGEESAEEAEEVFSESMACSNEAPVGEIIDRTKRTTQLLIDKLELLVEKDKELIDAVDKLQVLVSQCSSRRCEPECTCWCCIDTKGGCIAYCCAEIGCFPKTWTEVKVEDGDTHTYLEIGPCPSEQIEDQYKKIEKYWNEIADLIEGKKTNDTPGNIGIITIINKVGPEIIKDLENNVGYTMKHYDELFNCLQAKGAIIPPEKKVLYICCQTEYSNENGQLIQTAYGDCFEECYLEIGQDQHRECVQECLNESSGQPENTALPECIHELNFYVCEIK